jgi:hypothetical protein
MMPKPTKKDHHRECMKALIESQAVLQLLDDRYGSDHLQVLDLPRADVERISGSLRLVRHRLDVAANEFFEAL